jgi:hypothetical protein
MYTIGEKCFMRAEAIPFAEAIRLEKEFGRFGLFEEASRHGMEPPTAAVVAAWLQQAGEDTHEIIQASGELARYQHALTEKITATSPHQYVDRG